MTARFTELDAGEKLVMQAGGQTIVVTLEKKSGRKARLRIEAATGVDLHCETPASKPGSPKMLAG